MVERAFDYSKWNHIDISDDESDCHPNIEKETWFRLKRRQRAEKEQARAQRKLELEMAIKDGEARVAELKQRIKILEAEGGEVEGEDSAALKAEAEEVDMSITEKRKEMDCIERNKTWNWQNMCHVTEERTIINKSAASEAKDTMLRSSLPPKLAEALGAEQKSDVPGPESVTQEVKSYADFIQEHEDIIEEYCELGSMEKTRDYLRQHGEIIFADHCQSYLLLSCLEDEMNRKHDRMKLVARQSQLLSSITELAVSLRRPPQDVVLATFMRLEEPEHKHRFEAGVEDFIARVQIRAVEKRKEMRDDNEDGTNPRELTKEERMGPGGLDPVEVFQSLPSKMQDAFENQDTSLLKQALMGMTGEERRYHMKRCEDSGLWVPGAGGSTSVGKDNQEYDEDDDDEDGEADTCSSGDDSPSRKAESG